MFYHVRNIAEQEKVLGPLFLREKEEQIPLQVLIYHGINMSLQVSSFKISVTTTL